MSPRNNPHDELTKRMKKRLLQRARRDIIEIFILGLIAFILSFAGLSYFSITNEGNLDQQTILLASVTISLITFYVASVATLIPGASQDIRDRED